MRRALFAALVLLGGLIALGACTGLRSDTEGASVPPEGIRPTVWIQAGHVAPREPGYRAQAGASSGPFGNEREFNIRLARALARDLRAAGIDARITPARVTPLGDEGGAFVALHHDGLGGSRRSLALSRGRPSTTTAARGAEPRARRPTPTPHREALPISAEVEARSRELAEAFADRYRNVFVQRNGARSGFAGVLERDGNRRMTRYHGFRRTNADARVIVEAGAAGADDEFLRRTDPISAALADGILDYVGGEGR